MELEDISWRSDIACMAPPWRQLKCKGRLFHSGNSAKNQTSCNSEGFPLEASPTRASIASSWLKRCAALVKQKASMNHILSYYVHENIQSLRLTSTKVEEIKMFCADLTGSNHIARPWPSFRT